MNSIAPSASGAIVTSLMRWPEISCNRWNSLQSAGRTCCLGCAPRGPSSDEMYGPSRWQPQTIRSAHGSRSQAARIAANPAARPSNEFVMSVGQSRVTPKREYGVRALRTPSAVRASSLNQTPLCPLICKSKRPGATNGHSSTADFGQAGSTDRMRSPRNVI